jgi:hypothetical protein
MRVLNWNIQWRRPGGPTGTELFRRIHAEQPDLVCLTEAYTGFGLDDGYEASSSEDYGYPIKAGRRKVTLWSKAPWENVDEIGDKRMPPGRFVSGTTVTELGRIHVVGVCVPWSHAHVSSGRQDAAPWDEHRQYLEGLSRYLAGVSANAVILLGDFNQTVPRSRAPKAMSRLLDESLPKSLRLVTSGEIPRIGRRTVDHIALSSDLTLTGLFGLSNIGESGKQLSDHFGIVADIETRIAGIEGFAAP